MVLVILGALLLVSAARFVIDMRAWPFSAPEKTGDDYTTIALGDSAPDNGVAIGVLIRSLPDYESLVRLEVPDDIYLLRDAIPYGDRMVSPFFVRMIEDMIAGKIEYVAYDPVLTQAEVDEVLSRDDLLEAGSTVLVPASDGPPAYRLYTDPARSLYLVLPIEEAQ